MADIMIKAGQNTLMGISIVFFVLIFISFIIWLMGAVPKLMNGKKKKKTETAESIDRAVESIVANEEAELSDDLELVAVITAAIMASMGDEAPADGLVVRSIKKRRVTGW